MAEESTGLQSPRPICGACGQENHSAANYCAGCGAALGPGGEASGFLAGHFGGLEVVHLGFQGTGWQALRWGLWAIILAILVIPAAWGTAALARWFIKNLSFTDGTTATFAGTGGQIWGWMVLLLVSGVALGFIPFLGPFISIFVTTAIYLVVYRWFFRHLNPSSGETLAFVGGYWPYLGFTLLFAISIYSIVGWAWVATAMMRWFCRKISISGQRVEFVGRGWDALWRGLLVFLGSLLILPIPWLAVWYLRWIMGNVRWLRSPA